MDINKLPNLDHEPLTAAAFFCEWQHFIKTINLKKTPFDLRVAYFILDFPYKVVTALQELERLKLAQKIHAENGGPNE